MSTWASGSFSPPPPLLQRRLLLSLSQNVRPQIHSPHRYPPKGLVWTFFPPSFLPGFGLTIKPCQKTAARARVRRLVNFDGKSAKITLGILRLAHFTPTSLQFSLSQDGHQQPRAGVSFRRRTSIGGCWLFSRRYAPLYIPGHGCGTKEAYSQSFPRPPARAGSSNFPYHTLSLLCVRTLKKSRVRSAVFALGSNILSWNRAN